ncbi:MAG: PIN domain-containing protein [Bryobacterales bacterium]
MHPISERPIARHTNHLETVAPNAVRLCSVVKAELYYGAVKSRVREKTLAALRLFMDAFVSLPFDDRAARVYADIRVELEAQGTPIGPNDLLIAAIAVAHNATLVTHNRREFERVSDLACEDWES